MVRTTIIPKNTDVHLTIPQEYVGKTIEITYMALDELDQKQPIETKPSNNAARFKGMLTEEEAAKYDTHLKEVRGEWERDI